VEAAEPDPLSRLDQRAAADPADRVERRVGVFEERLSQCRILVERLQDLRKGSVRIATGRQSLLRRERRPPNLSRKVAAQLIEQPASVTGLRFGPVESP
jgi:hypothetical protein